MTRYNVYIYKAKSFIILYNLPKKFAEILCLKILFNLVTFFPSSSIIIGNFRFLV